MEIKLIFFLIFLSPFCLAQTNNDVLNKIFQEIEIDRSVWNEKVNRDTIIDIYENARIDTQQVYKKLPKRDHLQKLIDSIKLPMSVQDSVKSIALIRLFQQKYFEEYERTKYQYEYLTLLSNIVGSIYFDLMVKKHENNIEILQELKDQTIFCSMQLDSFIVTDHGFSNQKIFNSRKSLILTFENNIIPFYTKILDNKFNYIVKTRIILISLNYCLVKLGKSVLPTVKTHLVKSLPLAYDFSNKVENRISSFEMDWIYTLINYYEIIDTPGLYNFINQNWKIFLVVSGGKYTFKIIASELLVKDYSFFKEILQKTYDINELRDRYEAMCSTPEGREKTKDFLMKVTGDTNSTNIENLYLGFTFCYDKEVESFLKSQKRKAKSKELKAYIENIISHSWEYGAKVNY